MWVQPLSHFFSLARSALFNHHVSRLRLAPTKKMPSTKAAWHGWIVSDLLRWLFFAFNVQVQSLRSLKWSPLNCSVEKLMSCLRRLHIKERHQGWETAGTWQCKIILLSASWYDHTVTHQCIVIQNWDVLRYFTHVCVYKSYVLHSHRSAPNDPFFSQKNIFMWKCK